MNDALKKPARRLLTLRLIPPRRDAFHRAPLRFLFLPPSFAAGGADDGVQLLETAGEHAHGGREHWKLQEEASAAAMAGVLDYRPLKGGC